MKKNTLIQVFNYFLLLISFSVFSQTIIYVDYSKANNNGTGLNWSNAKKDLQVAIKQSTVGDQIWVKAGTYFPTHDPFDNPNPTNNRDKCFTLKNGVKIYGGFSGVETQLNQRNWKDNLTKLSGDLGLIHTPTDNVYHVVLSINLDNTTILDGFTITKGYATAPGQSSIVVNNRIIERYKGGGIYNSNSSAIFSNSNIISNSADCTDGDDDSWGAGVLNDNCSSTFLNCIFKENSFLNEGNSFGVFGSGMLISGGNCTIDKCIFESNTSGYGFLDSSTGGAIYMSGFNSSKIINTVFYNNTAQNGAAIGCGSSKDNLFTITNCTFSNNKSVYPGTTFSGYSKATFKNCILWNYPPTNSSVTGRDEIYSHETNSANQPSFINCIIRDITTNNSSIVNAKTTNCSNVNPQFENLDFPSGIDNIWSTNDDGLAIQTISPAKNIGITGMDIPLTDITGNSRDLQPDLGAYEYISPCVPPLLYTVTGGGTYCEDGIGHVIILLGSEMGVSYQLNHNGSTIGNAKIGTGNAISFGNQKLSGNYIITATRALGGCSSIMVGSVSITITPNSTPLFSPINSICLGNSISPLPTTSNNGITGTWYPVINNTQTTTYTFTPSAGQCANQTTITLTIIDTPRPSVDPLQNNCSTRTLADIIVNGSNLKWYDSFNSIEVLPLSTALIPDKVYYASQTISNCESTTRLPYTANSPCLKVNTFNEIHLIYSPNPVSRYLNIISEKENVIAYEIANSLGQKVENNKLNSTNFQIDMSLFQSGIYFIKIKSHDKNKTIKIIKN